jgi:hypothetical protein
MRTRECPNCHGQFSSSGSYRVHKHRYHRKPSTDQAQAEHKNVHTSKHDNAVIRYHAAASDTESKITPNSMQQAYAQAHVNMQQAPHAHQAPRNEMSMEVDQADMQLPEDTMRMALADSVRGMLQKPQPKKEKYDSIILIGLGALTVVVILAAIFSKKPNGSDQNQ